MAFIKALIVTSMIGAKNLITTGFVFTLRLLTGIKAHLKMD